MSIYDDVLGTGKPSGGHTGDDPKYSHWCSPGKAAGDASADKNAFAANRAGLQGTESPRVPYEDRERGDAKAPGRANKVFEAQEFDINQWD